MRTPKRAVSAAPALLMALALVMAMGGGRVDAQGGSELSRAVEEVEGLNALRSGLARAFSGEPDQATFAQVCRPVGQRAKQLAEENGWKVQQLAERHRNPAHGLDPEAERAFDMMERDPGLMGLWIDTRMDEQAGKRYFRRIVVEEACLGCHGAKELRPEFIVQGYPQDRAYGFQIGDLRGVYAVFVPGS